MPKKRTSCGTKANVVWRSDRLRRWPPCWPAASRPAKATSKSVVVVVAAAVVVVVAAVEAALPVWPCGRGPARPGLPILTSA